MSNASITFDRPSQGLNGIAAFFSQQWAKLNAWQRDESLTVADLLARADRIEATQPSFAADLRASALAAQRADLA